MRSSGATGLFAGVDEPLIHTKLSRAISPYACGGPVFELIDQPDPLRLRIWQAGPLRVAVLICKDVLDFPLAQHLAHLGVNVLFGPAMSGRTDAFRSHADWLMSDAQCVSLIVNGPLSWDGRAPGPSSMLPGRWLQTHAPITIAPRPVSTCCISTDKSG